MGGQQTREEKGEREERGGGRTVRTKDQKWNPRLSSSPGGGDTSIDRGPSQGNSLRANGGRRLLRDGGIFAL